MDSNKAKKLINALKAIEIGRKIKKRERNLLDKTSSALSFREKKRITEYVVYGDKSLYYQCPTCDSAIDRDYQSYCSSCGQCLNWTGFRGCSRVS